MEPARFVYHPTKRPTFPWADFRAAASEGRSVEVHGFTLGRSRNERKLLKSFSGFRFRGRVRFRACVFESLFDLAEARFDQTLHLTECEFRQGLRLHDASVEGRCSLRGSTLCDDKSMWLDWRGLTTGADLRVQGVIAAAPIDLSNARIGADLRLDGLHVVACGRPDQEVTKRALAGETGPGPMAADMAGKALSLHGARVEGHVLLKAFTLAASATHRGWVLGRRSQRARLAGQCDLRARIGGLVGFHNADVDAGTDVIAIDMAKATVGDSVFFVGGTRVTGGIDLRASVGGQVAFDNATIDTGTSGRAVHMAQATVGGSVFFVGGTRVTGAIDLRASVGGQVNFDNATVDAGTGGKAILMVAATVSEAVLFHSGTRITGAIDLRACIGWQVNFDNATVDAGTGGKAVDMDTATVGGSVFFHNGAHITGAIGLRASIEGQVNFHNATVDAGTGGLAINMEAATVGGAVCFRSGTCVAGAIDLRARIGWQVIFDNTTVDAGTDRTAIDLVSAIVSGAVLLRNGTVIGGDVDMKHATLRDGVFTYPDPDQITFDRPEMATGTHRVARECLITGNLDLSSANAEQAVMMHGLSVMGAIRGRHFKVAGDLHLCRGTAGAPDAASLRAAHDWVRRLGLALRSISRRRRADEELAPTFVLVPPERSDWIARPNERVRDLGWRHWETSKQFADTPATAIDLELAQVKGHLWIRGQRVRGGVNASLARIEGDASFDHSRIDGDLVLSDATIEGAFSATPAAPAEPAPLAGGAIDARGATIESVALRLGTRRTRATLAPTDYLFDGAAVGMFEVRGSLDRDGPKRFSMHRVGFQELDVERVYWRGFGWLSWRDWLRMGLIAVALAIVLVATGLGDWPPGWKWVWIIVGVYIIVLGIILDRDWHARERHPRRPVLDFLDACRFSSAFHIDVERWARAQGDDPRADEVFLKRRRRELRERRPANDRDGPPKRNGTRPGFRRVVWLWRWCVLDFMFGYGVRPARAIHLFVLLWLLNWAVFLPSAAVERPLSFETQAHAVGAEPDPANPAWPGDGGVPGEDDHWGPQRAFFLAMRVQVPPVELFVDAEWKPADRPMFAKGAGEGGWVLTYENWAAIMRILNLILVPVIIAGATGLLKPREARYTGAS